MKLRWKVAARAIVRRAFDLGLINAAQYRTANIQLVKTGQAKEERYDAELPLEEPELLASAVKALPAKKGRLEAVLASLALDRGMFELLTGYDPVNLVERPSADVIPFPRQA